MTITALFVYLIVALFAIGLVGFARIKGVVSKSVDLVEKALDAAVETADLAKEVNSKLINELKSGIKTPVKAPAKKSTKKVTPAPKKKNP